ncbi:MAG TPA: GAF domain-containing protein [Methylomirabilota bacterium]|jgi:signal transduction histidine kinase/CheY-like chemotaxis protein|nr:GAF domain-containing protein [Methylomirabilota bacterium]
MQSNERIDVVLRRRPARAFSLFFFVAILAALTYEVIIIFTSLLAPYRFPIPFAVPIFDTPFALVAIGGAYFCLERHRLRQDARSAFLGVALWLAGLLALAHILTQPDYPGTPGVNPGIAPYFFFLSYLACLAGIGLASQFSDRQLPLDDRARFWIAAGVLGLSILLVVAVVELRPLLPSMTMKPGRMTAFAVWAAGLSNGLVGLWALFGARRRLLRKDPDWFAAPFLIAGFTWLLGLTGFLIFPYRYAITWYVAGLARPVGIAVVFVGLLREQVSLYREARARQRGLESLYAAGQALVTSLDAQQIVNTIVIKGLEISGADRVVLFQLDGQTQFLRTVSSAGQWNPERSAGVLPAETGVSALAVTRRQPVWTADTQTDEGLPVSPEVRERARQEGLKACMAIPLLVQTGEVFGTLSLCYREERELAGSDLQLLSAYGVQVAVALEKARAFEQLALRARSDALLRDFSQRLLEAPAEAAILDDAVRVARDLLRADAVEIWLHDGEAGRLRLEAGHDWEPGSPGSTARGSLAAVAFERNETVHVEDATREPRLRGSPQPAAPGVRAGIAIPLSLAGKPVGALAAYYRLPHDFHEEERRSVVSLAQQTALALEKARLHAELESNLRRLQDTQSQLIQADKLNALGTLLSGMAHELNNPLTSILLSAQVAKQHPGLPDPVHRRLEAVELEAKRAAKIVKDLLSFARRRAPERQQVDFNEVIKAALALQAPTFDLEESRVVAELAPGLPTIWADGNQLQQVFLNLFTNAGHAMKSAHGRGTLTVRSFLNGSEVCAQVDDDGPGIPPDQLSRIFDPFFTTKPPGKGTGLGLSLSIGIVEAHGGRIEVENRPHGGARFTIRLPIGEGAKPVEVVRPAVRAERHRLEILVVDDEEQLREIVTEILAAAGHEVKGAATGREAIARLKAEAFDLVILDLRLPDVDGKEVWRWILAQKPALSSRVVFMTGDIMSADAEQFLRDTGRPVLSKPLTIERVHRIVDDIGAAKAVTPGLAAIPRR